MAQPINTMKNKLLFVWKRDSDDEVILIANNHMDLEEYLDQIYVHDCFEVKENEVIVWRKNDDAQHVPLKWIKHI